MSALAIAIESIDCGVRHHPVYRNNLDGEETQQLVDTRSRQTFGSAGQDHDRLDIGHRRAHHCAFSLDELDERLSLRLIGGDREDGGGVDHDHRGTPSLS
jgi:hypothetical protein